MRCMNCGSDIPEGMLICPDCGTEVRIVPDYNPLDDVLAREVKGSVEGATRPIRTDDIRRYSRKEQQTKKGQQTAKSTRVLSQRERDQIRAERMRRARQNAADSENERRRQQALRKKQARKKQLQMVALFFAFLIVLAGVCIFLLYQNSYDGVMRRGNTALTEENYAEAENCFQRAIRKDGTKAEAYAALAKVYIKTGELAEAESFFLSALSSQPLNDALYRVLIEFYMETDQNEKIPDVLEGCEPGVLEKLKQFQSNEPKFSLEQGVYNEVQEVALIGDGTFYYTTDGTEPTTASQLYTEPILIEEGTWIITAITVNDQGIPSLPVSATYTVEIPVEDAPAVTPSTGQYTTPTQITIQVPQGYTAYYTMDNTTPSAASTRYEGPIDMPQGRTFFAAVLISDSGKMTQVTKRNYVLTLE